MNPSESEPCQPGASGLQVELSAKSSRRFGPIWLVPLFVLLVGSLSLFAWWPNSSPTLSPAPSATPAQSPSTQPKITWSEHRVDVILSPGETATKHLTFTSSLGVQNVLVETVPQLAPFVSVQPHGFANVPAGQPQSIQLQFSIPASATLGTYDGIVRVRLGSQTLAQTLKIDLDIWNAFVDFGLGLQLKYPPNWQASPTATGVSFSSIGRQQVIDNSDENDTPPEIGVVVLPNPHSLSVSDFASDYQGGWYTAYAASVSSSVDDRAAIRFTDVGVTLGHAPCQAVFIQHDSFIVLVTLNDYCPADAEAVFDSLLNSIRFQ